MAVASLPRFKYILAAGDYLCMMLAFGFALQFRPIVKTSADAGAAIGVIIFAFLSVAWGVLMQYNNLYKIQVVTTKSKQIVLLLRSTLFATIGYTVIGFFVRPIYWIDSRLAIFLLFSSALVFLIVWRLIFFRQLWARELQKEKYRRRTAIIGAGDKAIKVASQLIYGRDHDIQVVGFVSDLRPHGTVVYENYQTIGSTENLDLLAREYQLDSFLIATDKIQAEELMQIAERCTELGKQVDVASDVYSIVLEKWDVEEYTGIPVVRFIGARNNRVVQITKRITDFIVTSIGLLILTPMLASIAIAIKLSSKGPLIYRQRRVGKNGKEFYFYKFRTMTVSGEDNDVKFRKERYNQFMNGEAPEKIINESRVTPIGRFLRRTSLDELPQLWNVIKGDMSLVGPRPPVPYEYEMYTEWQKKRLAATPGCTGLWQISDRLNISFTDMVLLDFYYIENMSLWLDLQIILKTIPVMIFGRGGK